jgi:transposase-like protein
MEAGIVTANETAREQSEVHRSTVLESHRPDCPECGSSKVVWAYRFHRPEFKLGALMCQGCNRLFDVTPRH